MWARIWRLRTIPYILLGIVLTALGLMAMEYLVNNFWPFDPQQRLDLARATVLGQVDAATILEAADLEIVLTFLATVGLAATGIALPVAFYLNLRFGVERTPIFLVVLRQAMWFGAWVAFCAWLQMHRSLGIAVVLLVAVVLALFEILLQVRTRAAVQAEVFRPTQSET